MRRLLATVTVLVACLLGLPATAQAAPAPIGGGSILFNLNHTARCTAAFAARSASAGYLLAGPGCSSATQVYSGASVLVGPRTGTDWYSVVQVANTAAWTLVPWIDSGSGKVTIRGSRVTPVGGSVCLLSRTTGTRCGTVTALNQTIQFPDGTITGVTRTNICLEPDAIAFVSGDQAQGTPIGGSGSCSTGGVSYFQPVNPVLSAYGLTILTG
ncbi:MAG TPA: S1 family peptidase [Actinophytocola sp.]|jgi:streptogrisin C|uniref:S1 family peptidase n=1 Tax=Actinophytocola sp. TaxID=1872138 RepID=UPI002F9224FF